MELDVGDYSAIEERCATLEEASVAGGVPFAESLFSAAENLKRAHFSKIQDLIKLIQQSAFKVFTYAEP